MSMLRKFGVNQHNILGVPTCIFVAALLFQACNSNSKMILEFKHSFRPWEHFELITRNDSSFLRYRLLYKGGIYFQNWAKGDTIILSVADRANDMVMISRTIPHKHLIDSMVISNVITESFVHISQTDMNRIILAAGKIQPLRDDESGCLDGTKLSLDINYKGARIMIDVPCYDLAEKKPELRELTLFVDLIRKLTDNNFDTNSWVTAILEQTNCLHPMK